MSSRILVIFFLLCRAAWALELDATRAEVLAELGKPRSIAQRGGREILLYPNGVRLELQDGKIVSAEGIKLGSNASESPEVPKSTQQLEPATAPVAPQADELDAADAEMTAREEANAIGASQAELEKSFDALVASREQASATPMRRSFNYVEFAAELVLIFLMTVAALKLACKYWGAEVFWSGILTVSSADAVIRGALKLSGELLLELPTLFYLDELIAGVVMVLLLKKLSVNRSTSQAVQLTITTKTFTVIVGAFLVSFALNSLH